MSCLVRPGDTRVNETDMVPTLMELTFYGGRQTIDT